jgi:hypothetical protein
MSGMSFSAGTRRDQREGTTIVGDVEELDEVWDISDTCYDRLEKYIAKALKTVIIFRMYKVFAHTAI